MSSESTDTRTRILETALRVLKEQGGGGVRMADIAKQTGVSRQAVYLHFASRAELLEAVTRYVEELLDIEERLAPSRTATSGAERLEAYVQCWGDFLPHVYPVARALINDMHTDPAAASAWNDRMAAMRHGCEAVTTALHKDGKLAKGLNRKTATDLLWTLLSVQNWENLTLNCGWSHRKYTKEMHRIAARLLVAS